MIPSRALSLYERITGAYHGLRRVKPERFASLVSLNRLSKQSRIGMDTRWLLHEIADLCDGMVTDFPITFGGMTIISKFAAIAGPRRLRMLIGLILSALAAGPPVDPDGRPARAAP